MRPAAGVLLKKMPCGGALNVSVDGRVPVRQLSSGCVHVVRFGDGAFGSFSFCVQVAAGGGGQLRVSPEGLTSLCGRRAFDPSCLRLVFGSLPHCKKCRSVTQFVAPQLLQMCARLKELYTDFYIIIRITGGCRHSLGL